MYNMQTIFFDPLPVPTPLQGGDIVPHDLWWCCPWLFRTPTNVHSILRQIKTIHCKKVVGVSYFQCSSLCGTQQYSHSHLSSGLGCLLTTWLMTVGDVSSCCVPGRHDVTILAALSDRCLQSQQYECNGRYGSSHYPSCQSATPTTCTPNDVRDAEIQWDYGHYSCVVVGAFPT